MRANRLRRAWRNCTSERKLGFEHLETYAAFDGQVKETKRKLLEFLIANRIDLSR